jgi:DNA helicase-2/ATP-dependent DNA helicase PcrA
MSGFRLRPEQQRVIDEYTGGFAAISAVPGAGKTTTLSALAAELIQRIGPRQRVVIVTFQNAAVANFQQAVTKRLEERNLPARGFMVRTLHSLALEVLSTVRHRAELDAQAQVIDEADAIQIRQQALEQAIERHKDMLLSLPEEPRSRNWPDQEKWLLGRFAEEAIRMLRPYEECLDMLRQPPGTVSWLPFALDIFSTYRQELRERGLLEYDDMVSRAVMMLETHPEHCERLRKRWPYLLEDEAQDSSPLQERMLRLLAGDGGNLVRVGDANQSILTTFTNSDVEGFRKWLNDPAVTHKFELAGSSRSTETILQVANGLVRRVQRDFPLEACRQSALRNQMIDPIYVDGVLQNPPVSPGSRLGLSARVFEHTDIERNQVLDMAITYLEQHPDKTVAILVGSKNVGYEYALAAVARNFPDNRIIRLLSGQDGRAVPVIDRITAVLAYLEQPDRPNDLAKALECWSGDGNSDRVVAALRAYIGETRGQIESLLYPEPVRDPADILNLPDDLSPEEERTLERLRAVPGWLDQRLARPHELLGHLSLSLPATEEERRTFDAIITTLSDVPPDPSQSRFDQLKETLKELKSRHRRLRGTHEEHAINIGPGTLTISTRHQAKGLEWDVVFAIGCDDFWFPASDTHQSIALRPWLGPYDPALTLKAEITHRLAGHTGRPSPSDLERIARADAIERVSEGIRVMYVTITRARRALWISWHQDGSPIGGITTRNESAVYTIVADLMEEIRMGAVGVAAT